MPPGASASGRETFEGLSPSARKMYLHWINNATRAETRTKRIEQAIDRLTKGLKHPHA